MSFLMVERHLVKFLYVFIRNNFLPSAIRSMPGDLCTAAGIISLSSLSLVDVTDATLGASGQWLGTRTGGTATLA